MRKFLRFPPSLLGSLLLAAGIAVPVAAVTAVVETVSSHLTNNLAKFPPLAVVLAFFVLWPLILTASETVFLIRDRADSRWYDLVTIPLGVLYSVLFLGILQGVEFGASVTEQIYEINVYSPVDPARYPTLILICLCAAAGWAILTFVPKEKLPPLACVLSLAALYLGCGVTVVFAVQTVKGTEYLWLALLPLNAILITARLVRSTVRDARGRLRPEGMANRPVLGALYRVFVRAETLPLLAAVAALPLLGLIAAVLILFGQSPDSVVRAWTETAEWNLSQVPTPEKLPYDMHYLCTVAARGHRKIVKPLRLGVRHGHPVTANRQLLVANAFEDLLQKRTPRLHRAVRGFYDAQGLPIARRIQSPLASDAVYLLMKPAEWFFLLGLYLFDPDPESRIAAQYTGKKRNPEE